jgi:hypothetical protein
VFVGREEHLDALRRAFDASKVGRAVIVAVHGGSGMGKSALVRRFLEELKDRHGEAVVLVGRCYERESVPYKALDALVDALSRYLRRLPTVQAEAYLPHDILALARVFPVLRQVGAVNRARRAVLDIPDSVELRRRAFRALREIFVRIADRRPLVLFIDDLQWGDLDSAALLEGLLSPPDPPALLLIGCYRSEEAETSPLLKTILPKRLAADPSLDMRDLVVGELSGGDADALAQALLGSHPPRATRSCRPSPASEGQPVLHRRAGALLPVRGRAEDRRGDVRRGHPRPRDLSSPAGPAAPRGRRRVQRADRAGGGLPPPISKWKERASRRAGRPIPSGRSTPGRHETSPTMTASDGGDGLAGGGADGDPSPLGPALLAAIPERLATHHRRSEWRRRRSTQCRG